MKKFSENTAELIGRNWEKAGLFLVFIFFGIRGLFLTYPDINLTYPFLCSDSYDWLANGFFYAGYDVNFSFRPPALPLFIALLERINLLDFLPFFNQIILGGIVLTFFKIAALYFDKLISFILSIFLALNDFFTNLGLYILADCYALFFMLLGIYFYFKTEKNERNYFLSSFFLGISFLFQYALAAFLPAIIIHSILSKKKIKIKTLAISLIILSTIAGTWLIFRKHGIGLANEPINHTRLINFHTDAWFFYLINILAVFGAVASIIILWGFFIMPKNQSPLLGKESVKKFLRFNLTAIFFWIIFWVFLYDWNDRRFIIYLLPFLVFLLGAPISLAHQKAFPSPTLKNKLLFFLLAGSVLWSSSLPYRNFFSTGTLAIFNGIAVEFDSFRNARNEKVANINAKKIEIKKYSPPSSHLAFIREYRNRKKEEFKNKYQEKIGSLKNIQSEIIKKNNDLLPAEICVLYENNQWYRERNIYGNYFKTKLVAFPKCETPILRISSKGKLELIK